MTFYLQNWLAFSKLHSPIFTEHGSVKFPNSNPPTDENNNAYCEVSLLLYFEKEKCFDIKYVFVLYNKRRTDSLSLTWPEI